MKSVMYKVTISVEHKIATGNKSGEILNNEMAVLNPFEVHRDQNQNIRRSEYKTR